MIIIQTPVIVFSVFITYVAGRYLTSKLLPVIEKLIKRAESRQKVVILMPGEKEKPPRRLTEGAEENLCKAGGVASVALVVLFMLIVPKWAIFIWLALIGLGYLTWFVILMFQLSE